MKNNFLSTLFVGIDVSSKINVLCNLDFQGNKLINLKALNNQPDAESILESILARFKFYLLKICCYCFRNQLTVLEKNRQDII